MFARIVTFTGATNIDGGLDFIRDTVTPTLRQQKGFRGLTVSADRTAGVLGVLSLWESDADRDASDSALAKTREEGQQIVGGTLSVEHFEQVLWDVVGLPPRAGAALLLRRMSMDPAMIDDNLEYFTREVLPQIKAEPGLLGVRQMIDRSTGNAIVGTVWTDADAMRAAAESAQRRQQTAAGRVAFGEQSQREVLFIGLP